MPENKNSFIKSKMNKDLDDRLLPNNEYRDALNVAISRSEGSDVGALEAILGNKDLNVGASGMKIIGYVVDESNEYIYWFSTDFDGGLSDRAISSDICTVNRYNISTANNIVLVSGYFLNFSKQYPMYGVSLMENLLFWTDNKNQPRKINIERAATFNADTTNPYYTTEDQISVCKFAPWKAPDFINLRSQESLLPNTMSNAADATTTTIGSLDWTEDDLAVSTYQNNDEVPEVTNGTDWDTYNTNEVGCWCNYDNSFNNGVTYGKLYNKWAVLDSRGLAPVGFSIPTKSQWDAMLISASGASTAATQLKSTKSWDASVGNEGNNDSGFNALAGGERNPGATFANKGAEATFWTSDAADNDYFKMAYNSTAVTTVAAPGSNPKLAGRSVRCIKNSGYRGWQGDPEFLIDKFVKFSYRFKFDDNEYSVIAPFSQDVFIPQQEGRFVNDDEDAALRTTVVEFMQNEINNAVLNITLPSIDMINDYKVSKIEIIFKESDSLAYQVLESINVDTIFINNLNETNIYQYNYQSSIPFKTLPEDEGIRVYDKVPVRSLAQETSGNRIIYGNLTQGYTAPNGLDYFVSIGEKGQQNQVEYPEHSIKENRNYQVGIILADKYGRESDIILSNYDGLLDANDDPQPGSNIFNDYKNIGFANNVLGWGGDGLKLNFQNTVPEAINYSGLSGYPGAYAVGEYYAVLADDSGTAYFEDLSNQELAYVAPIGTTYTFNFTGLTHAAAISAANSYQFFVNNGDGWENSLIYSIAAGSSSEVELTYNSATAGNITLTTNSKVRFQIYYGTDERFKYKLINIKPNGLDFDDNILNYFIVNKYLSGEYKDYTNITLVSSISGSSPNGYINVETKEQISSTYLFRANGTSARPEPELDATGGIWATYTLNPNGWYTYRVAIKQQEQEYYNVYLPGIVNGYPIQANTDEQSETGFTTLVSDNINKIPRNLQEVGPLDDQFNSDTRMYPRVTNTNYSATNPGNKQFVPSNNSDKVELIGTVADVFPDIEAGTDDGEINQYCIYDYLSKPFVAKFSTQKTVGVKETLWVTPVDPDQYPSNMTLAVYETKPILSRLELYWETSTSGLVSELNYEIQNETGNITGLSSITSSLNESMASGTTITNDFFPTAGGSNVITTTAVLNSVYSKDTNGELNVDSTSRFALVSGSQTGSFKVNTSDTFYADENNVNSGYFEFSVIFTQDDGTISTQNFHITLDNINPLINAYIDPTPALGSSTIFLNGNGPSGVNGSATLCSRHLFPSANNAGWTLTSLTIGGTEVSPVSDYFVISQQSAFNTNSPCTDSNYAFGMTTSATYSLVASYAYVVTAKLTDALGAQITTDISFSGPSDRYDGQVIYSGFEICEGSGTQSNTTNLVLGQNNYGCGSLVSALFRGTVMNWTTDDILLYIRVGKFVAGSTNGTVDPEVDNSRTATGAFFGEYMDQGIPYISSSGTPVMPTHATDCPSGNCWSNWRQLAHIDAFTNNNTQINAGVKPGQKYPADGSTYDYTDCVITNAEVKLLPDGATIGTGWAWNIAATKNFTGNDVATIPGANVVTMLAASYTVPPFFGDGTNPTTTTTSGIVGPSV